MANKFQGDWQYHFLEIDKNGTIKRTPKGKFHLNEIDANGKITKAKDDDNKDLTGDISKSGPFEIIHLNRADPPKRHLRGVLAFEGIIDGVFCMVLVGERRGTQFPLQPARVDEGKERVKLGQEDGTWIATKP